MNTKIPVEILSNSNVVTTDNQSSTISDFTGATEESNGARGFVPAPTIAQRNSFLRGDGSWSTSGFNVDQNVSTANNNYPLLLTPIADATSDQGPRSSIFASGIKANPSTATITATTFSGSLSGNASSATEFASNQSVTLTGDVTGTVSSKAGWSVATTLANSGVTAGSYGPSDNASPAHSETFTVPYITVDAKGRVTALANKTITLPSDNNTDTLVTQNKSTTNATYPVLLCPTADANANQGEKTSIFAAGVKVNPSTGVISASGFSGPLTGDVTGDVTGNCSGSSGSCTGNAGTATKLAAAKTIDGMSFDGSGNITHYVTCSTGASTAAKTASLTGFTLATGSRVFVKFSNTNTAANPTLNINSTGAKSIYINGAAVETYYLQAGCVYEFVYNGTQWDIVNGKVMVKFTSTDPGSSTTPPTDLAEGGILIYLYCRREDLGL